MLEYIWQRLLSLQRNVLLLKNLVSKFFRDKLSKNKVVRLGMLFGLLSYVIGVHGLLFTKSNTKNVFASIIKKKKSKIKSQQLEK